MCRLVLSVTTIAAALGTAAVVPAAHAAHPRLGAVLDQCHAGAVPADRIVTFQGAMPALAGTHRMWMRFDLQRRRPGERRFVRMRNARTFGRWERSDARRRGFVFRKRADGLPVPYAYRAVVRFRWYDAGGRLQRRALRRTPSCRQPDLRPDVQPGALAATIDPATGLARYAVVVRNAGRGQTGAFSVGVATGDALETAEVDALGAGETTTVSVLAPACAPASTVRVMVDVGDRVHERREDDGDVRRPCPLGDG